MKVYDNKLTDKRYLDNIVEQIIGKTNTGDKKELNMSRSKLPEELRLWLSNRGFNFDNPSAENYLSDDEVYSAACELWDDMHESGNLWNEDVAPVRKAQVKRWLNRYKEKCSRLDLSEWYSKGN